MNNLFKHLSFKILGARSIAIVISPGPILGYQSGVCAWCCICLSCSLLIYFLLAGWCLHFHSMKINDLQCKSTNTNHPQRKSMTLMKINDLQWKPMTLNEIQWTTMTFNENQWLSMKINDDQCKSMNLNENQWTPMRIIDLNENPWTSMNKSNESCEFPYIHLNSYEIYWILWILVKCNEFQRNSLIQLNSNEINWSPGISIGS